MSEERSIRMSFPIEVKVELVLSELTPGNLQCETWEEWDALPEVERVDRAQAAMIEWGPHGFVEIASNRRQMNLMGGGKINGYDLTFKELEVDLYSAVIDGEE